MFWRVCGTLYFLTLATKYFYLIDFPQSYHSCIKRWGSMSLPVETWWALWLSWGIKCHPHGWHCVTFWVGAHSVVSVSLRPHGLWPARLLCPQNFPGKDTGVGCHFFLQGISQTRDQIHVSCVSWTGRKIPYHWVTFLDQGDKGHAALLLNSSLGVWGGKPEAATLWRSPD